MNLLLGNNRDISLQIRTNKGKIVLTSYQTLTVVSPVIMLPHVVALVSIHHDNGVKAIVFPKCRK